MANPEPETAPEFHLLVAGLPRTGKSTGLNNIFDLDLPAGISATPITDNVVSEKITRNDISVTVTDTPGLKAAEAHKDEKIMRDITKFGLKKDFLLIVTLSVHPNSCITQDYCNILKNLTTIFGKKVWNWSLVLLTFSDDARKKFRTDQGKHMYVDYLRSHCAELQKVLNGIGVNERVSLFTGYENYDIFKNSKLDGIVAIPVGEDSETSTNSLFPLQPWTHNYQWTQLAIMEISKIGKGIPSEDMLRSILIQFQYGKYVVQKNIHQIIKAGVVGACYGAVAGAKTGFDYGAKAGCTGGIIGTATGAIAGGAAGMAGGGILGGLGAGGAAAAILYIEAILELQRNDQANDSSTSSATPS